MSMKRIGQVYIADTARVLGEVDLGADVSVWYGVVMRGDVAPITIGEMTNVQDNSVVHCDKGFPNVIGKRVTIGHGAIVHGVFVGDGALIGMGARLLGRSQIGAGALVAAGALVREGMVVPAGMVAMGVPAKVMRETTDREKEYLLKLPPRYVEVARMHCDSPDNPLCRPYGSR